MTIERRHDSWHVQVGGDTVEVVERGRLHLERRRLLRQVGDLDDDHLSGVDQPNVLIALGSQRLWPAVDTERGTGAAHHIIEVEVGRLGGEDVS